MNNYKPNPINTDKIILSEDILKQTELLAKNVHEVWAKGRMDSGWTYGPERNDHLKQHPTLIPYENLSESEKNYDRKTALESIKILIKLGFKIHR